MNGNKKMDIDDKTPLLLKIHHIDVGQGDSTLIVVKQGRNYQDENKKNQLGMIKFAALIDAGKRDIEGRRVLTYLRQKLRHKKLDYVICSHFDTDHWGGLPTIFKSELCDAMTKVLDQGGKKDCPPSYKKVVKASRAKNKLKWTSETVDYSEKENPQTDIYFKESIYEDEKILIKCIAANGYVLDNNNVAQNIGYIESGSGSPKNQRSLAFLIQYNGFRYYTGGDIGNKQEFAISNYFAEDSISAFKVSHHGATTSTVSADTVSAKDKNQLLEKMKVGAIAFICCGDHKGHLHPKFTILNKLFTNSSVENIVITGQLDWISELDSKEKKIKNIEWIIPQADGTFKLGAIEKITETEIGETSSGAKRRLAPGSAVLTYNGNKILVNMDMFNIEAGLKPGDRSKIYDIFLSAIDDKLPISKRRDIATTIVEYINRKRKSGEVLYENKEEDPLPKAKRKKICTKELIKNLPANVRFHIVKQNLQETISAYLTYVAQFKKYRVEKGNRSIGKFFVAGDRDKNGKLPKDAGRLTYYISDLKGAGGSVVKPTTTTTGTPSSPIDVDE